MLNLQSPEKIPDNYINRKYIREMYTKLIKMVKNKRFSILEP